MTAEDQRILGGLASSVEHLTGQIAELRRENNVAHDQLFGLIHAIEAEGCAPCKRHDRDIDELKRRPERLIAVGAAIVAMLTAAWNMLRGA